MDKVTIQLDARWAKFARSPLHFVFSALQGVSITFAPLFLYWSGKGSYFKGYERIVAPACFAVIFVVPFFYYLLGSAVIHQLRQK